MNTQSNSEALPPTTGSPSSETPITDECTGPCICHAVGLGDQEDACPREKMAAMERALRELVSLKDLKRKIEAGRADDLNDLAAMEREYDLRKPIAWGAARATLSPENA